MAATRPSIMSEGAMMSTPARACETAVLASSCSVRLRQGRQDDRGNARRVGVGGFIDQFVNRKIADARDRGDRLAHPLAGTDEEWIYQRLRAEPGFAHQ